MTPREAAEKAELEALVQYLGARNFKHAGDAAEMKAAFEQASTELNELKAKPDDLPWTDATRQPEPDNLA